MPRRSSATRAGRFLLANPVNRLSITRRGWNAGRRRRTTIKADGMKAWFGAVLELGGFHLAAEARDCLLLMALTGVRPGEALALLWDGCRLCRSDHDLSEHEEPHRS